jgi:hypothetical protein
MILVPRGAEYRAVMRADARSRDATPVLAVPAGGASVRALDGATADEFIILGLCGALDPELHVGDVVVCESASCAGETILFDEALTARLAELTNARRVGALTVERIVTARSERVQLYARSDASVAEMEGFHLARELAARGCAVAMVRVVSDEGSYDLPDIARAIGPDGSLRPLALLAAFARSPVNAVRFIGDARRGLSVLEKVTAELISR